MKHIPYLVSTLAVILLGLEVSAQKQGIESIHAKDLKKHMQFLASDELKGRDSGEPGLEIAARYLAVQARALGLEPADADNDFLQKFTIQEKAYDHKNSRIIISDSINGREVNTSPFYWFTDRMGSGVSVKGEVVFAGYGINDASNGYNDFEGIDIKDKLVLIMDRAPMNEAGTEALFDPEKWSGRMNFRHKLGYINSQQPEAVLIVPDPKSGFQSIGDSDPGIADFLSTSRNLEGFESRRRGYRNGSKVLFIHRSVADQLMEGTGKNLEDVQMEIDRHLNPRSFSLDGKNIDIELRTIESDLVLSNVFGMIEGSDPLLKEEVVIYLAHYDHVGVDRNGEVFNGADDNASGTVALIEIAEAFLKAGKPPRRSIGFLWVSAEEIGLYGSKYFAEYPLVATEKTAAVINVDMIGRTRTAEDDASGRRGITILGGDSVKVIGAKQSRVLMDINVKTLQEMGLKGNYLYNDLDHPERYFYRSDHISFARKDIPVIFYSTGTHRDYHRVTDVEERIDYDKFLKMTRFCYKMGYNVAQYGGPIEVDNPMSGW